jgi:hypothetical protein
VTHQRDEDCTLDADEVCVGCGVSHRVPCEFCGGRGFHRDGCAEGAGSIEQPAGVARMDGAA